ncbi:MAG: Mth938-like domain-containing protein [Gammaproteobacteria bacterium]|nr:Mth938-like domain-containing protein [Gammaproteobacteria bacterium]
MRFAEDDKDGLYRIRAYAPGSVTVNDETLTRSLVISSERLIRDWPPQSIEELAPAHLFAAAELKPEILILGTGATLRFPHPSLLAALQTQGIGVEVMDTAAACRTYNVLVNEQRRVAAALFMI